MATQQAWMDEERKRHLNEFTSKPQSMTAICNEIRLKSGEQVHKDIVHAIVQITGYGKQQIKDTGLIEPRELLPDGTLCTTFASDFQALVDHFLIELRAGVLFFPKLLPDYAGWVRSFWSTDRPQWKDDGIARAEIRGGMLLMFENIKNNGVNIDLTGAEVYQSFITKDCDDCGSGIDAPDDDIVYCDTCHVGHHQSCYDIYPRPGPRDTWKCRVCEASKQASARKRKSSSTPKKKSTPKNVRQKEENSDYKDHHYKKTSSEMQEHGMRRSSLDVPLKQGSSQGGRRVVSQPAVVTPVTEDSKFLARTTLLNKLVNVLEEAPTSSDNTSVENRAFSFKIRSESSKRSIKAPSEGTPCPEPRLHHPEIEGTILLTRLKDDNIFRKVLLSETRDVITLFKVCAERWPEKFGAGGISRLLYIDEENHHVEIVKRSSPDYKEFLRMIQRRWYMEGSKEVIQVKVILLASAENLEL